MKVFGEQLAQQRAQKRNSFKKKSPDEYKGFVPAIDRELEILSKQLGMSPLNALRSYAKQMKRLKKLEMQNDHLLELTNTDNTTNAHRVVESMVKARKEPEWLCVPASIWEKDVPSQKARVQLFYQIRNLVKRIAELQIPADYEHLKEMYFTSQAEDIINHCHTLIENHYTQRKEDMRMQEALGAEIEKVISKFPMPLSVVQEMRSVVEEVGKEYGEETYYLGELKEKVAYVLEEGLSRYAERDYPEFFADRLKNFVNSLPEDVRAEVPEYITDMVSSQKQ